MSGQDTDTKRWRYCTNSNRSVLSLKASPVCRFGVFKKKDKKKGVGVGGSSTTTFVKSCTWRWPACLKKGAQSVMCWLWPLIENCLQYGTHLLHDNLYCLRKVAPSFRGCIIVRSQYFYGWKIKSILHRKMYSWKKKHFVHHSWCLR